MTKSVWIVMLLVGVALLSVGITAANSVASEASSSVTGTPTDQSLLLMIGGGVVALLGAAGLISSSGSHRIG
ncbi:MAG TPA: DUF3185 family protein [Planctomycetota bacterium]|nr:DUF3185 family protein [Planctomycetota bacterium]